MEKQKDMDYAKKKEESAISNVHLKINKIKKDAFTGQLTIPSDWDKETNKRKASDTDPFSRRSTHIEIDWFRRNKNKKKKMEEEENGIKTEDNIGDLNSEPPTKKK